MFAVIKTGGKQYVVKEGDLLDVEKLGLEAGRKILFEQVLLIDDGANTQIGTPLLPNAVVKADIVEAFKDDKILVFKKKRRKDYSVKRGHRQDYTEISIDGIEISMKKSKKADEEPSAQTETEEVISEVAEVAEVKSEQAEAAEVESEQAEAAEVESEAVEAAEVKSEQAEAAEVKSEVVEAAEVKSEVVEVETAVSEEKAEKKAKAPRKKKDITDVEEY